MYAIEQISQPDQKACVAACVAMVTGFPVEKVMETFHPYFMGDLMTPGAYLRRFKMNVKEMLTSDRFLSWGYVYLCTVPSLNKPQGIHEVVLDLRATDDNDALVFDPQKGNKGKLFYSMEGDEEDSVKFKGRVLDVQIGHFDHWHKHTKKAALEELEAMYQYVTH